MTDPMDGVPEAFMEKVTLHYRRHPNIALSSAVFRMKI
jgi:hypothetical protein